MTSRIISFFKKTKSIFKRSKPVEEVLHQYNALPSDKQQEIQKLLEKRNQLLQRKETLESQAIVHEAFESNSFSILDEKEAKERMKLQEISLNQKPFPIRFLQKHFKDIILAIILIFGVIGNIALIYGVFFMERDD